MGCQMIRMICIRKYKKVRRVIVWQKKLMMEAVYRF